MNPTERRGAAVQTASSRAADAWAHGAANSAEQLTAGAWQIIDRPRVRGHRRRPRGRPVIGGPGVPLLVDPAEDPTPEVAQHPSELLHRTDQRTGSKARLTQPMTTQLIPGVPSSDPPTLALDRAEHEVTDIDQGSVQTAARTGCRTTDR